MSSRPRDLARACAVLAALVVLVLALTGCAPGLPESAGPDRDEASTTTPQGRTPQSAEQSPAPCDPDTIEVSVVDGTPAPGVRSLVLTLANRGPDGCALDGHAPAVSLLDGSGAPIPTVQVEDEPTEAGQEPVGELGAGDAVTTTLSWRMVPAASATDRTPDCHDAAGLRLYLPGGPLDVGEPLTACDGGTLRATPYSVADTAA